MAERIPESFLDDLRARLPVSDVVRRRIPALKKEGREWKALSPFKNEKTPSFTVNDDKALWSDFSSGKAGDVFRFEMEMTGCTFIQAVKTLAEMAGMSLPGDRSPAARPRDDGGSMPAPEPRRSSKVEITATYDYTDPEGVVVYQVCRREWQEDGKRKKSFLQRRPGPQGGWIWGLDAGTYCRGKSGDWYRLTKDRESWPDRIEVEAVAHRLYQFVALREETVLPEDERRIIFSPEGEKDCETLAAWDLVATDSSGGSKKWSSYHADELRGCDVVVLADADASGREYAHRKAASLRGIAKRVRLLDWRDHWPNCPEGADVTDWRNLGGGDRDRLMAIVDKLPDWMPVAPDSAFNAVRYIDLDKPARELEWLVKNILTRGEVSIWYGPPGCGKSFLLTDAAMSVARGVSWFGNRVRSGLVVYQAGEGGLGLKRRLRAHRQANKIATDDDIPFVLLPSRVDLFNADADVDKLIIEINAWKAYYDVPLELVCIDTFSAASPGANENASEDVSKVLTRAHRIAEQCRCHVALVHHTPKAGGSPRGHSSLLGNVENAIEVIRHEQVDIEQRSDGSRVMRDIREFVTRKQKDGQDGWARRFVLKQVKLGLDIDGDEITSCIIAPLAGPAPSDAPAVIPRGYANLAPNNQVLMRALARAIKDTGAPAPADAPGCPADVPVVRIGDWLTALSEMRFTADPDDPDGKKLKARCRKAIERACADYGWADRDKLNLIGKAGEFVWRTSRKVNGIDPPPMEFGMMRPPNEPLTAPGEDAESIADVLAADGL